MGNFVDTCGHAQHIGKTGDVRMEWFWEISANRVFGLQTPLVYVVPGYADLCGDERLIAKSLVLVPGPHYLWQATNAVAFKSCPMPEGRAFREHEECVYCPDCNCWGK